MKFIWKALLHASAFAAEKLYKSQVSQVDVWLGDGRKLMLMSREEEGRLKTVAKTLSGSWTEEEKRELSKAIAGIRHRSGGDNDKGD